MKVYRLVSKNSIEEAILHCAEKKLKLEMDVTGSGQKGRTIVLHSKFQYKYVIFPDKLMVYIVDLL